MKWTRSRVILLFISIVLGTVRTTRSQDVVYPGSTVQGDILRGDGQFLKGIAWYEINAAKAREIDAKTAIELERWNREVYEAYQRDRADTMARRTKLSKARTEAAQATLLEREKRLRHNPTMEDIYRAHALNALLVDLSDPSIQESAWQFAKVPLPDDLSIKSLVFRFTSRPGVKGSQTLSRGVIALARLDMKGRWPSYLSVNALASERTAFEEAYGKVREESLSGRLAVETVLQMDGKVEALENKVSKAVPPERGYRAAAARFVRELKKATGMFDADTVDFAREMISDTQRHDAHTVAELLAFMRKYRLMVAPADGTPGVAEKYSRLYDLMRRQKDALGLQNAYARPHRPGEMAKTEIKNFQGVWSLKSNEWNGSILPQIPSEEFTLSFDHNKILIKKKSEFWYSGTWKVDPTKTPKEIDIIVLEGRERGTAWLGIYTLEADTLRVCMGKTRPEEFKSVVGAGCQLLYCTRVAP